MDANLTNVGESVEFDYFVEEFCATRRPHLGSVHGGIDTEMAMAFGDVFSHAEVTPFALADFAVRCGVDRQLTRREGLRIAKLAAAVATTQAQADVYEGDEERAFVQGTGNFVTAEAHRWTQLV